MTGEAERVAHIKSPPAPASVPRLKHTSWYMSDHYICLQYLLLLSLIFRLCWLWRNRELVWDIVRGKFAKQLLSVFFLPNEVISYVYKGQSICSVLVNMQHHVVAQLGLSLAHFDPFRFWLFWCLISRYYISCWLFLAEQKYDFVHLLNSKVHRKTTVHNLTMIDNTLKL